LDGLFEDEVTNKWPPQGWTKTDENGDTVPVTMEDHLQAQKEIRDAIAAKWRHIRRWKKERDLTTPRNKKNPPEDFLFLNPGTAFPVEHLDEYP
jgi:hypothetical protein